MIAQVVVNIPTRSINKYFSYSIPPGLEYIGAGWRVLVPFGGRRVEGFVMSVEDGDHTGLKAIEQALDDSSWFDEQMIETAQWISDYYLCTLAEALRLFIPGKSGIKSSRVFHAVPVMNGQETAALLSAKPPAYEQVYTYLLGASPQSEQNITKIFGFHTGAILRNLIRLGLVTAESTATAANRPRYEKYVDLAVSQDIAAAIEQTLTNRPAQLRLLALMREHTSIAMTDLKAAHISADTVKRLTAAGIVTIREEQVLRDSYAEAAAPDRVIMFTPEQQAALAAIVPVIHEQQQQTFLLHGITGSGKTEIYLAATAAARRMGRQAIVLVPEIALTNQIVSRFKTRFGDDVVVIHSKLSVPERFDAWQRLRSFQAGIVIGARSAVFAPVNDLGLVIIDEEHEFTYKQEEAPRYHTREVAIKRAQLAGAVVILGSATPSIESFYKAETAQYKLLTLSARVDNACIPEVVTVDMREELIHGRRSVLSETLFALVSRTIAEQKQAVIVLNRRGYSTFVLCRECGHVVKCHHCSVSMVYHAHGNGLRCHYCQSRQETPDVCPVCESRYIRYFGTGTQKVEEELTKLFPAARIVRMDQDTTGGKLDSHQILDDFAAGKYDILLGTQMVAKGHDIQNVTAVGILAADSALNLPDFRAAERTFNLITQAAGRAGRGTHKGHVVVQTYNPDHYAVVCGAAQDYAAFYKLELPFRRQLSYPPFRELLKITIQAEHESLVKQQAGQLADCLQSLAAPLEITEIFGPTPTAVAKVKNMYRMMILIKAVDLTILKQRISEQGLISQQNVTYDVDPVNLL